MGTYEITTDGGTYQIETEDAPTLGSEVGAVARRGLQGITSLVDLAENINPFQPKGPRAFGLNPIWAGRPSSGERIEAAATNLGLTTEQPKSPVGKIFGEVAYFMPGAIGGGTPGVISSLGAGLAGGTAKAVGASPLAQGLASIFGALAPSGISVFKNLASKTGQNMERSALNVQRSDLQKAAKFQPKGSTAENPLILGIEKAREKGIINAFDDPASSIAKNNIEISRLNGEVSGILEATKKAQTDVVTPTFSNTKKFIESNPYQAEQLTKQYQQRVNTIADVWDGTVSSLQNAKTKLYKIAYKGTTESKELDQAIARDLKESIEAAAARFLSPQEATKLKALNAEEGLHLGLRDLLLKNKNLEKMPQGLAKALRRLVVSPIGGSAAGIAASVATGNPIPAVLGAIGGTLATKPGLLIGSSVIKGASKMVAPLSGGVSTAIPNSILSLLSPRSESENTKPTQKKNSMSAQETNSKLTAETLRDAVIAQESGGKANAISDAGAVGLMQLMPSTAKEVAAELGLTSYDLKDPEVNKQMGTYYLQKMLDAFGGDPELALTAYHSGPGRVKKLLELTGGKTLQDILLRLGPVGQRYAKQVLARLPKGVVEA